MRNILIFSLQQVIVYHSEQAVPIAQQERYTTLTPTPTPRRFRSRSRSQMSGRTSHDADSIKHDSNEMLNNLGRMNIQSEGINGFVKKNFSYFMKH